MQKRALAVARARRRSGYLLVFTLLAAALAACASGDESLDAVDPQAVTADPTYDQVLVLMQNKCVSCHEGSDEGEEEDLVAGTAALVGDDAPGLEDCTSIVALRFDILDQVENNTMPPGALPRLTSEEKLLLRRWVENGAPAPCN